MEFKIKDKMRMTGRRPKCGFAKAVGRKFAGEGAFLPGRFAGAAEFANVGFPGSADLRLFGKSIVRRGAHIITVAMKTTTAVKTAMFVSAAALFCLCGCADSHLPGPAPESAPKSVLADAPRGAAESGSLKYFPYGADCARYRGGFPNLPSGAPDFEVELPRPKNSATVFASDFGFDEANDDCAAAINRALAHCRKTGASKLALAPGTYRCFGDRGVEVDGFKDFEIDGRGATLVFRRPSDFSILPQYEMGSSANFTVKNCLRVRISGMKIDWDWNADPLGAFVRITDKKPAEGGKPPHFDVEFVGYEKYPLYGRPMPVQVMMPVSDTLDGFCEGAAFWFGQSEGHFGARSEWLSPNRARIYHSTKAEGVPVSDAYDDKFTERAGAYNHRAAKVGGMYRLMHYYYGKNAFNLDSNAHLTLEDIDVYSCRGMAVHISGAQKYWKLENFNVVPPRGGAKRPCTSTADVVHSADSLGYCKIINCAFSMNEDDIINLHDRMTFAEKVSDRVLRISNKRGNRYFGSSAGDVLELFYGDCIPAGYSARVSETRGETLELDSPLPEQKGAGFWVSKSSAATGNILVRGCVFENFYGRGIFQGKNVTVENCRFVNGPSIPLKFQLAYTVDKWAEGGGCSNAVVRGCVFENCNGKSAGMTLGWIAEIFSGAIVDPASGFKAPARCASRGILVEKNRFKNLRGLAWLANVGENLVFRDNEIEISAGSAKKSYAACVFVGDVKGARIVNNTVTADFPAECGVLASAEAEDVVAAGNVLRIVGAEDSVSGGRR